MPLRGQKTRITTAIKPAKTARAKSGSAIEKKKYQNEYVSDI
jgi:hypothetical protein